LWDQNENLKLFKGPLDQISHKNKGTPTVHSHVELHLYTYFSNY